MTQSDFDRKPRPRKAGLFARSALLSALLSFASRLYRAIAHSLIGRIMTAYDDVERAFSSTFFVQSVQAFLRSPDNFFRRLKRRFAAAYESSRVLSWARMLSQKFFLVRVSSVGLLFFTFGIGAIMVQLLQKYTFHTSELETHTIFVGATLVFLAVPLFFSKNNVAFSIRESRILSYLLFEFLKISPFHVYACAKEPPRDDINTQFLLGLLLAVSTIFVRPEYLILGILAALFVLLVICSPEFGILCIFLTLPFLGTIPLAALVLLICFSYFLKWVCGRRVLPVSLVDFPILAFVLFTVSGGIFTLDRSSFFKMAVMVCFSLGYFLVKSIVRTPAMVRRCLYALAGSAALVSLYGLYQNFFGSLSSVWQDATLFSDIRGRAVSTFENPNVLGEYLILLFPVLLAMIGCARNRHARFLFLLIAALDASCLVFTWSRGAWLGFLVAAVLFFLLCDKRFLVCGLLALPIAGAALFAFGADTTLVRRLLSIGNFTDSSTSYRLNIWRGTLLMLSDVFLFGIGIGEGAFARVYPAYAKSGIEAAPHSHNLFLQITTETGIFSLIVFLLILFVFAQCCLTFCHKANKRHHRTICIGILCGVVAFLVQGMTDYVFYNYRIVLLFWMMLGLGVAHVMAAKSSEEEAESLIY